MGDEGCLAYHPLVGGSGVEVGASVVASVLVVVSVTVGSGSEVEVDVTVGSGSEVEVDVMVGSGLAEHVLVDSGLRHSTADRAAALIRTVASLGSLRLKSTDQGGFLGTLTLQ